MTGYMRRSRLARLLSDAALDDAMCRATGLCAHCPDCESPLEHEAYGWWCPDCQAAVTDDRVRAEGG